MDGQVGCSTKGEFEQIIYVNNVDLFKSDSSSITLCRGMGSQISDFVCSSRDELIRLSGLRSQYFLIIASFDYICTVFGKKN